MNTAIGTPSTIRSGSVLACYGVAWVSWVISVFTPRLRFWRKAPSHVAIVAEHDGVLYVHESTTLGKHLDAFDKTTRRGVQAHRLDEWLLRQRGPVDHYPLKVPPPDLAKMLAYLLSVHERKMGYSLVRAFHAASPVRNSATGKDLVCSELVGFALQEGGSIETAVYCSELTPYDVIQFECFDEPERLVKPSPELLRRAA